MSQNSKSIPVDLNSPPNGSTDTYPQTRPQSSYHREEFSLSSPIEPNNHPWWAESDYIPPYIQHFVEANAGLSLVCAAQLFFALMNVTVKYFISSTDISIPSLILVRQGITVAGCVFTLHYLGEPNPLLGPPEMRRLLLARGLFGTGALVSTYESFQGLSVSDTTAIQFLTPSVLVVLGYLILREKTTRRELIAGFLCLCGVLLVSRPPFLFGDLEQEVEVPPGRVNLPGNNAGEEHKVISRAAGVAWAFASVFGSSFACRSPTHLQHENKIKILKRHRSDYSSYRQTGSCSPFYGLLCIHVLHWDITVRPFSCPSRPISSGALAEENSVVLFVPGQGKMPNSFKGFFFIILIGVCSCPPAPPSLSFPSLLHSERTVKIQSDSLQIFGFIGQTLLTLGLQREKAGRASLAIYTSVFFAIVLELVIFHTFPSLLSLVGVSIILTSGFWVAVSHSSLHFSRRFSPFSWIIAPLPFSLQFGASTLSSGRYEGRASLEWC